MNRRALISAAILIIAIAIGAGREFVFINLNYQLDFAEHSRPFSYAHSRFQQWTAGWSAHDLLLAKWLATGFFIGTNLALAVLLVRVRLGDHRYRMAITVGFALIATIALAAHFMARYVPGFEVLSIKLLHALQYPVLLLVLWAATWLRQR